MKKATLFLILAVITAGGAFAQKSAADTEKAAGSEKKNAIGLDTIPLFRGFIATDSDVDSFFFALSPSYERIIVPHWSVGVRLDFIFGRPARLSEHFYYGMAAHGRWYPLSNGLEKLYLDFGIGFNTLSFKIPIGGDIEAFTGLTVELKVGWKQLMGPVYLEPSLGYFISKSSTSYYSVPTPLGWQPGLAFGAAF